MNKPKMVIFDYGNTLIHENSNEFDDYKAAAAIMKYATANKRNLTVGEIAEFSHKLFLDVMLPAWKSDIEVSEHNHMRLLYGLLELEFGVSFAELELLCWHNAVVHKAMPHIENVLDYLKENNIRTGVISNISWSGEALSATINKYIPDNGFEFIISTGDYNVKKPNHYIFDLALVKAGLNANDVWYCGDNLRFDVYGSHGAGIFPVWYRCNEYPVDVSVDETASEKTPDFPYLHITDWRELISVLEETENEKILLKI